MPGNLQKRSILIFGRPIATFYACYYCGYFVFVSFSVLFSLCVALLGFFFLCFFSFCIQIYNCSLRTICTFICSFGVITDAICFNCYLLVEDYLSKHKLVMEI